MHTHADKAPENKSQSAANAVSKKQSFGEPAFQFVDNRPEAIAQKKQQEIANNSPQVRQLKAFQEMADNYSAKQNQPVPKKPNNTGLPDNLKSGIENLSGYSMDRVKVHYNSDKPAQLNAHAYAQGSDIHLASGQEKYLAHEAWHVVQQKQGRVKPSMQMKGGVAVNDDKGLEHEADMMGAKAMRMKSEPEQIGTGSAHMPMNPVNGAESGKPVQRVVRDAQVSWAITHLVQVRGESLFGEGGDWQSREITPDEGGQLSQGQLVVVDDEAMFMSRRGPNQENPERRQADKEADALKYKWLKVLAVKVEDGLIEAPENTYVRAETIKLIGVEKPLPKDIGLQEHGPEDVGLVSGNLSGFHLAWQQAAAKRRRSIGRVNMAFAGKLTDEHDEITSGWNWDKYDEGQNVSGDMKNSKEREVFEGVKEQHTLSANYSGGEAPEPIAYMVLEKRDYGDGPFMYIRWLIAHPEKGGGGSALIKSAISSFNSQDECTELRVESAFSAVGWYESMGFQKVDPEKSAVKKGVGYADTELVYRKED
ncbi:MAG: eCIS core domain-containing protein [Methylobacter sp.]